MVSPGKRRPSKRLPSGLLFATDHLRANDRDLIYRCAQVDVDVCVCTRASLASIVNNGQAGNTIVATGCAALPAMATAAKVFFRKVLSLGFPTFSCPNRKHSVSNLPVNAFGGQIAGFIRA